MSYKEKREFEQLEKDIEALEAEKKEIEESPKRRKAKRGRHRG